MIKINNENIRIRPSAIDTFYGCAYQWGKTYLEGVSSIPNARAAIGTAIHHGIEKSWEEAMSSGTAEHNLGMMSDAAVENLKEQAKEHDLVYNEGENVNTCSAETIKGLSAWKEDISMFLAIPKAVETFYKIDINHSIVSELGGTVDYLAKSGDGHVIDDVKTSKRKVTPAGYSTQQAIYKYLAEANGDKINQNRIQSVVLKKEPDAHILSFEPNVSQAKTLVNGMLDALDLVAKDVAPIETILRGNPKYTFCSQKFCAHYSTCPFVNGKETKKVQAVKL